MKTAGARSGQRSALWWLIVAALTLVGGWVRGWQLDTQIVLDDEFWTLQAAAANDVGYLLSHHHFSDYSIPLALWTRWLIVTTGVTEWGFRLPVFALGCLAVPLAGFVALRFGRVEGAVTAALIASSPALVLYSRYARPYMLIALFLLLAIVSCLRWLETGRHRHGGMFAFASALAIYCSAIAAPAVIGVWTAAMAVHWLPQRFRREPLIATRGASMGWVAAACAMALALYAPSWTSFWEANVGKLAAGSLPAESWWGACQLLFGVRSGPVAIGLSASSALGAIVLARRSQWLPMALLVLPIVFQGFALVMSAPHGAESSYVLARYFIVALPLLLILLGVGLTVQVRFVVGWLGLPPVATAALAFAIVGAGVRWGPLPEVIRANNDFVTHPDGYAPSVPSIKSDRVSPFYGFLKNSDAEAIVEVPWPRAFRYTPYAGYQALHGLRVWTVSADPTFAAPGVRFASTRPVAELRNRNVTADYVVLHKHVSAEMLHVAPGEHPGRLSDRMSTAGRPIPPPSLLALQTQTVRRALKACLENPTLERVYEDDWVEVFATNTEAARNATRWNAANPVR